MLSQHMLRTILLLLWINEVLCVHGLTVRAHDVVHLSIHLLLLRSWRHWLLLPSLSSIAFRRLLFATTHVFMMVLRRRLVVAAVRVAVGADVAHSEVGLNYGHLGRWQPTGVLLFRPPMP